MVFDSDFMSIYLDGYPRPLRGWWEMHGLVRKKDIPIKVVGTRLPSTASLFTENRALLLADDNGSPDDKLSAALDAFIHFECIKRSG